MFVYFAVNFSIYIYIYISAENIRYLTVTKRREFVDRNKFFDFTFHDILGIPSNQSFVPIISTHSNLYSELLRNK